MRRPEVEAWALGVVEQIGGGHPLEDPQVELKREWPDPMRAARRLAAHANAARGEPILWLVGVDEQSGIVAVEGAPELADWHA
jgi:hypothetical protein